MKRRLVFLMSLLAVLLITGQVFAQDATPAATDASTEAVKTGGTLRVGWDAEWASLDPHVSSALSSFYVLANVVQSLTDFDNDIKLTPVLATSWDQSADGLTWTFHLRDGVKFSNGRAMDSADVLYSFQRIMDPKLGSGRVNSCGGADAKFAAPDATTFTITTTTANAVLPVKIAGASGCAIVAKESVGADGTIVVPIGTGPFSISNVDGTTGMTLVKNPNYWQEGLPYLDEVDIKVISEESVRETALLGGEVDLIFSPAPQSYESLASNPDLTVAKTPELSYSYLGINTKHAPLDNKLVRQAISYALDRQAICDAGDFSLCAPISGPTAPGSPWYTGYEPYLTRDVDKAKALLAQAGVADGLEITLMPSSTYENTVRQAQVVQQNLADIGIKATINAVEWTQWLDLEGAGNYDIYVGSWNGLTDADAYYYSQQHTGEVFNFTGYSNPDFDKLVEAGRATSDFDKRLDIYKQADKMLVDDAPYVYFYAQEGLRAYKSYVKGYVTRPDLQNVLWTTWLDQ